MRIPLIFPMAALFATVATCVSAQTPPKPASSTAAKKGPATTAAHRPAAATGMTTDDQKTLYALGLTIYKSLGQFNLTPAELDLVKRGMTDAAAGKPAVELNTWGPKIETLARARSSHASSAFLTKAAAEPGATKLPSGLIYKELKAGAGASPAAVDTVKVNYRGTFVDGKEFDSSYSRNQPASFPLNGVIKCWTEGVQKMKVGGKARLVCPSDIAYGDQGRGGIPGGATLVFEIELLEVTPAK
jgi:FKBP-type peptidyl-prolyl cis-trans isomerase FkpA